MKKNILLIAVLLVGLLSNAQIYSSFDKLSLERVYVHQNATLLFVGEYIYFKVYSLEVKNNAPSKVSKIAYVELIGKNNNIVFKEKITLEKGVGYGEFFIPTTVPSGNYKLIAYTKWMQNNSSFKYFESELNIINPYLGNQGAVTRKDNNKGLKISSTENNSKTIYAHRKFKIETDKEVYHKRELIKLNFINAKGEYGYGKYSISVRKIDKINKINNYSASQFNAENFNKKIIKYVFDDNEVIPEVNGELISGKLNYKSSEKLAGNRRMTLSIPGNSLFFKIVETDKNGEFNFYLDEEYDGNNAFIQTIGDDRESYNLTINKPITIDYKKLTFNSSKLTPEYKDFIKERSVYNQIENSYFSVKPDSLLAKPISEKFYKREGAFVFELKDYKYFPNLNEVFIEIIDPVYKKRIEGEIKFFIKHRNDFIDDQSNPLVLLDGVMIEDNRSLLQYSANKVERITVLKDRVSMGLIPFSGVIAIDTKDKDYNWNFENNKLTHIKLKKPIPQKKYFQQNYSDSLQQKYSRIPDYRNQLLWNPEINLETNFIELSFYTSDLEGDFEIILEGFTNIGEAISLRKIITVKK